MTRHTYPLAVARTVAMRTLDELATDRPGWRPNPDYWMQLLAESLRQMVEATAADRVIDVATPPVPPGHLAQHRGGKPECTVCGVVHDWAVQP